MRRQPARIRQPEDVGKQQDRLAGHVGGQGGEREKDIDRMPFQLDWIGDQVAQERASRVARQCDGLTIGPVIDANFVVEGVHLESPLRPTLQHLLQELPGMNAMSGACPEALALPQELAIVANGQGHVDATSFSTADSGGTGHRWRSSSEPSWIIFALSPAVKLWCARAAPSASRRPCLH